MSDSASIRLRQVFKRFGERVALAGIDLQLEGTQLVGVVGPDGAGKTTLLRTLAGLLEIEAAQADVLGVDLRAADMRPLKNRTGYVPQAFSLPRDLSVLENLRFTARLHQLPDDVFAARSAALLARTGLAPFTARPAGALSGGMRQKLAISCALLADPALLLLDEPTAGVDVVARDEIWAMLRERRDASLILISTSYLEEVEACERLIYLDGGRIVASGTPAELRAGVALELYRIWGAAPRALAAAARALPYVSNARASGHFARIEVPRMHTPGTARVLADLRALSPDVQLAEATDLDMESTLLALARPEHAGAAPPGER